MNFFGRFLQRRHVAFSSKIILIRKTASNTRRDFHYLQRTPQHIWFSCWTVSNINHQKKMRECKLLVKWLSFPQVGTQHLILLVVFFFSGSPRCYNVVFLVIINIVINICSVYAYTKAKRELLPFCYSICRGVPFDPQRACRSKATSTARTAPGDQAACRRSRCSPWVGESPTFYHYKMG